MDFFLLREGSSNAAQCTYKYMSSGSTDPTKQEEKRRFFNLLGFHLGKQVLIAKIGRAYGVRGWTHLHSFMTPEEQILDQTQCTLTLPNGTTHPCTIEDIKKHGAHFVAKIDLIPTREDVIAWVNSTLSIDRSALPELAEDEYYLEDLIGLDVLDTQGTHLGSVAEILATGANDVLIIATPDQKQSAIPYILDVIQDIDLDNKRIQVDWELL